MKIPTRPKDELHEDEPKINPHTEDELCEVAEKAPPPMDSPTKPKPKPTKSGLETRCWYFVGLSSRSIHIGALILKFEIVDDDWHFVGLRRDGGRGLGIYILPPPLGIPLLSSDLEVSPASRRT